MKNLHIGIFKNFRKFDNKIDSYSKAFIFVLSVIVICAVSIDYGFLLDTGETAVVQGIYNVAWWCYFTMFTLWLLFSNQKVSRAKMFANWILGLFLYLSVLPKIFDIPDTDSFLHSVWSILSGKYYNVLLLLLFALLEVSRGTVNFINKKVNPALVLAGGFLIIIFVGTILLLLPHSTQEQVKLPVTDAIFIATSAVCVTGLSPLEISSAFTFGGKCIILALIQIGGLGVMTVTSFFAMFFMGTPGLYNQFALKDMIGSDTFGSLVSTLGYIFGFTFIIESAGALFIWLSIHSTMGMTVSEEVFFSIFHSVSAFCNAGFSTLDGNLGNACIIEGHNMFFIVISLLVVLGGIGFPILENLKKLIAYCFDRIGYHLFRRQIKGERFIHIANVNTKLVLVSTSLLLVVGTVVIAVMEWNNAFASMDIADKIVHSFFNAVVPRTAGFNSVSLTAFSAVSIILYIMLMWIGGASQSTAGGIKVNTIAVSVSNFISTIRGKPVVAAFNREIAPSSLQRASATILGSIMVIIVLFILLVLLEPEIAPVRLLFETVSAYSTVGASLDTTPLLGQVSKLLLSFVMLIGRVGLMTMLMGLARMKELPKYRYPQDNVIIN